MLVSSFGMVQATHFAGGEITYEHYSGNTWDVTLRLYRDCAGINFGSTQSITLSPTNSGSSFSVSEISRSDITPLCSSQQSQCFSSTGGSGIQQIIYRARKTFNALPAGQVYTLSNQSCCRNFAITTLSNGGNNSWRISSQLDPNISPANSSPTFLNPPVAFVCVNQPVTISPNAFDPDGDALQYSLTACLQQTGGQVTYLTGAGITPNDPLFTSTGFSLDPGTGQLSFTPSQVQVGVVCIRVSEFRNGVKIGEVIRDIQIQVQNCNNTPPTITPIANQIAQVNNQLCVPVTITDADGDNISASAVQPVSGTFTVTSSGPGFLNGTWCWTPGVGNQGNSYAITINAQDDACPQPGVAQETFTVTVPVPCNVTLSTTVTRETCPGSSDGAVNLTVNNATQPISYSWTGTNGFSSFSEDISGLEGGHTYTVVVVDGNNCAATATVSIRTNASPVSASFNVTNSCSGGNTGAISISASGGTAPYQYSIDGGTTFQSGSTFSGLASGNYQVYVKDATGCSASPGTATVSSSAGVNVSLTAAGESCYDQADGTITSSVSSGTAPFTYAWSDGGTTANRTNLAAGSYTVTVTDANGCTATASASVDASDLSCCECTVSQGNVTSTIRPILYPQTATQFYNYGTPNNASANTPFGYEKSETARLFLYEDQNTGNISYFTILDRPNDGTGGSATIDFFCLPTNAFLEFSDDPGEWTGLFPTVNANWNWAPCCTDGGVIGGLSCNMTFDIFPAFGSTINGIEWLSGSAPSPNVTAFNTTDRIRVSCGTPQRCCPDDFATTNVINPVSCIGSNDGSASVTPTRGDAPFSYSWSNGSTSNSISNVAAGSYTVTITDAVGCGDTVTVNIGTTPDNTNPVISCPSNISVGNATGQCGANVSFAAATATDNCPGVTVAQTGGQASGSFFAVGTGTITYTATDLSGNTASCSFTVTVNDTEDPTIACPANISVNNDAGSCDAVVAYNVSAGDNCPGENLTRTAGLASGSTFPLGSTTVSYQVVDAAGNSASCSFTVTVTDNENPTIACPSNISVSNDAGICGAAVSYNVASNDNCAGSTLSQTAGLGSGSTFPVGTTTESYTVTDAAGNTASCSFTVTVTDNENPTISCPANISVSNDAGNCGAVVSYNVGSNDNCPGASLAQTAGLGSGSTFPIGTTTESYTVTDAAGNTASCSFTVTVSDNENPTISCPANISVSNDAGICGAVVSYNVGSNDNCPGSTLSQTAGLGSGSTFPVGTTTESYTVTDAAGNTASCSFTVTVNDTEDPTIACPANITVSNDAGSCDAVVAYNVSYNDNCPGSSLSQTAGLGSGSAFPLGTTTESYTVTDAAGNTASCSFTVTVNDTEDPTITCPANITVSNDAGICGAAVSYSVAYNDNCPGSALAQTAGLGSGSTFPVGTTTESYTVTDASGNTASCSFTVTVNDTEDPTISCPANITVNNDAGICGAAVSYNVGFNDNCSGSSLAQTAGLGSGSTFPVGTTTESYTVTDASGNTASCSFTVTVVDNENPTVSCPANITVNNDAGICGAAVSYNVPFGDNCPGSSIAQTAGLGSGSTFPVGTTTESYTVTDAAGNTASCSFTVTVVDNENPTVSCPANITVNTDAGICGAAVSYNVPFGDNCPGSSIAQTAGLGSGSTFPVGTTTESYTVTDAAGNTASCSFTVTVIDNEAPTAICQDVTIQLDANGQASITAQNIDNGSNDACGIASLSLDQTNFDCAEVGPNTVTLTVTDNNGNVSTCTATVTVEDNIAPSITCPANITVSNDPGICGAAVSYNVGYNDNCPGTSLAQTAGLGSGSVFPVGTTTESYTVTDASGNTASCSFTVTVNDTEVPSITCPADITLECLRDIPAADPNLPVVNDNCGVQSVVHQGDADNGATGCSGDPFVINRTYLVTDIHGNTNTCTQVIRVESTPIILTTSPNAIVFPAYQDSACTDISVVAMGGCPGYTYQWSNGETTATQNVCPTVTTVYTVTVTDAEGCNSVDSVQVCVIDITCTEQTNNGQTGNGNSGNGVNNGQGGGQGLTKLTICHVPPGNPANAMTKCLSPGAVASHISQHPGDYLGACGSLAARNCDFNNSNTKTGAPESVETKVMEAISMEAFPNPFRAATTVRMVFPADDQIELKVYDLKGQMVATLYQGAVVAGQEVKAEFRPENVTDGVYMARLVTTSGKVMNVKLILTR